jgi:hypothetical protein
MDRETAARRFAPDIMDGRPPAGFDDRDLVPDEEEGMPLAYVPAVPGSLPSGFDRRDLIIGRGPVAWGGTIPGRLPEGCDMWHSQDPLGQSVSFHAARRGISPTDSTCGTWPTIGAAQSPMSRRKTIAFPGTFRIRFSGLRTGTA